MGMKKPPHPGLLVKENIDGLGLTVAQAAEGLGVTRQQLYKVINCQSAISPEMAMRLEKALGSTAEAWLTMQAAYDLAQVRGTKGNGRPPSHATADVRPVLSP